MEKRKVKCQCFSEPEILKCLVLFRPKDIQFTVIEEERKQTIFRLRKLESDHLDLFLKKKFNWNGFKQSSKQLVINTTIEN